MNHRKRGGHERRGPGENCRFWGNRTPPITGLLLPQECTTVSKVFVSWPSAPWPPLKVKCAVSISYLPKNGDRRGFGGRGNVEQSHLGNVLPQRYRQNHLLIKLSSKQRSPTSTKAHIRKLPFNTRNQSVPSLIHVQGHVMLRNRTAKHLVWERD